MDGEGGVDEDLDKLLEFAGLVAGVPSIVDHFQLGDIVGRVVGLVGPSGVENHAESVLIVSRLFSDF